MLKLLLLLIPLTLTFACGKSLITIPNEDGQLVTINQSMGGRGCIAVDRSPDGSLSIIVQQDASSDWAGIRALPAMVKVALTTFFGNRDTSGETGFTGPSDIQGCAGVFESTEETLEEDVTEVRIIE